MESGRPKKEMTYKVLWYGPAKAGKTSLVKATGNDPTTVSKRDAHIYIPISQVEEIEGATVTIEHHVVSYPGGNPKSSFYKWDQAFFCIDPMAGYGAGRNGFTINPQNNAPLVCGTIYQMSMISNSLRSKVIFTKADQLDDTKVASLADAMKMVSAAIPETEFGLHLLASTTDHKKKQTFVAEINKLVIDDIKTRLAEDQQNRKKLEGVKALIDTYKKECTAWRYPDGVNKVSGILERIERTMPASAVLREGVFLEFVAEIKKEIGDKLTTTSGLGGGRDEKTAALYRAIVAIIEPGQRANEENWNALDALMKLINDYISATRSVNAFGSSFLAFPIPAGVNEAIAAISAEQKKLFVSLNDARFDAIEQIITNAIKDKNEQADMLGTNSETLGARSEPTRLLYKNMLNVFAQRKIAHDARPKLH